MINIRTELAESSQDFRVHGSALPPLLLYFINIFPRDFWYMGFYVQGVFSKISSKFLEIFSNSFKFVKSIKTMILELKYVHNFYIDTNFQICLNNPINNFF